MSPIVLGPGPSGPTFADSLLADLGPFLTPEQDPTGAHAAYLTALAQCFEQVFGIVMDVGYPDDADWVAGYSQLLDIDNCPDQYLGYLAQFNGTVLPVGVDAATARQMIRMESGQARGTPGAIISAAQRNLTGTQSVVLLERTNLDGTPNAYFFVLVVRPEELPSLSALEAAVSAVKPGGVLFGVVETDGWTVAELEADYATMTLLEAAFSTVSHLESDVT